MVAYKRVLLANRKLIARATCFCLFNFISYYCAQSTGTHTPTASTQQYSYIASECVESTCACARALKFFLNFEFCSMCARFIGALELTIVSVRVCVYFGFSLSSFSVLFFHFIFVFMKLHFNSWCIVSYAHMPVTQQTSRKIEFRTNAMVATENDDYLVGVHSIVWVDLWLLLFIVCWSNIEEEEEEENMEETKTKQLISVAKQQIECVRSFANDTTNGWWRGSAGDTFDEHLTIIWMRASNTTQRRKKISENG